MKIKGFLAILAILLNSFTLYATPSVNKDADPLLTLSQSRQLFLSAMKDPYVRQNFQALQLNLLLNPVDKMYDEFFKSHPIFSELYKFIETSQDNLLQDFMKSSATNRKEIVRGMNLKYDLLDKLIVETAVDLGFSEEVIRNRKVFVQGGNMNAFTVSGTSKRIIVVFNEQILEKMDREEIAAVLAHELGHIRAGHTIKGMINSIFLSIVNALYSSGQINISKTLNDDEFGVLQQAEVVRDIFQRMQAQEMATQELKQGMDQESHERTGGVQGHDMNCSGSCSHIVDTLNILSDSLASKTMVEKKFQNELTKFIMGFLSPEMRDVAKSTIADFLQTTIKSLQLMQGNPEAIAQFQILLENLQNIGRIRYDSKTITISNVYAMLAASRAFETSADQISASSQRNMKLASSMAKLAGVDFDHEDRSAIFDSILKQAEEFLKNYNPAEDYRYVGTSHPAIILRVHHILTQIPSYPSIAFANPFLRNTMLAVQVRRSIDANRQMLMNAESRLEKATGKYQQMTQELIQASNDSQADIKNEKKAKLVRMKEEALSAQEKVMGQWQAQVNLSRQVIMDLLKFVNNFENNIINLMLQDGLTQAKRSPRFENFVQLMSIQKEIDIYSIERAEQILSEQAPKLKDKNPKAIIEVQKNIENAKLSLSKYDKIINKVIKKLDNESNKKDADQKVIEVRKAILQGIVDAQDRQKLEKIRALVTQPPKARDAENYYSSRIPVKMNSKSIICSDLF